MAIIKFDERDLDAQVPDLAAGGAWTRVRLRWRRDPLTGTSARILTGEKLQPETRPDLAELTTKPSFCPFDSEYLEKATVPFPAELTAEGRIREGRAVVVPNIMAYATHSAVGIYDPGRHFLDLDELTPTLVGNALAAMVRHARAVRRLDPAAAWSSINTNYLPPSGASLVHPHLQSAHDACGLTSQRLLVGQSGAWQERRGSSYRTALVETEADRPRWVGRPPGGLADPVRADRVPRSLGRSQPGRRPDRIDRAGHPGSWTRAIPGSRRLPTWNLASFNFAMIGRGPLAREQGYQVVLKMLSRSNPEPYYRSDATYFDASSERH